MLIWNFVFRLFAIELIMILIDSAFVLCNNDNHYQCCERIIMYVCICNALKEKELKKVCKKVCPENGEAVIEGAGCKVECGQCLDYIDNFLIPSGQAESLNNANLV